MSRRHDAARSEGDEVTGDRVALVGLRPGRPPAQRAGRCATPGESEQRRRDGHFYPGFLTPKGARATRDAAAEYRKFAPSTRTRTTRDRLERLSQGTSFPACSVHHVADHIDHLVRSREWITSASARTTTASPPCRKQLEDVSCYPILTQALLDRAIRSRSSRFSAAEHLGASCVTRGEGSPVGFEP